MFAGFDPRIIPGGLPRRQSAGLSIEKIRSGNLFIDIRKGNRFVVSFNQDITSLKIMGATSGKAANFTLVLIADGTPRTLTWPSRIFFVGGVAPTLSSVLNREDWLEFETRDGGFDWNVFYHNRTIYGNGLSGGIVSGTFSATRTEVGNLTDFVNTAGNIFNLSRTETLSITDMVDGNTNSSIVESMSASDSITVSGNTFNVSQVEFGSAQEVFGQPNPNTGQRPYGGGAFGVLGTTNGELVTIT